MSTSPRVSPIALFTAFLRAGGLAVGDGYATIAPLRSLLVKRNRWLDEEAFAAHLAVVQAMPGIFNVNLASYLGRRLGGRWGCIAALLGMVLPPMVVLIVFATFYDEFRSFPAVAGFLKGTRPAIIALILLPAFQLWRKSNITLSTVWIPVGAAIAIGLLGISPTLIVVGLAILAVLYGLIVHSAN